ncbi:hypothetical protein GGS23DRAFT_33494 [Durotheca rogersii]|uniref:uncharacterized protein n=1 Tax=Durotheca rogersii TaxID=419775 RepID=UPI002220A962|nr:uncharacterized protein GGS23DRAFT_33494 [Durotheca rogersii]KAI5868490.1 hypothetical protein GGS23DRAFT_33494 [Durotheca rogersii]
MVARRVFTQPGCSHCRLAVLKFFTHPTSTLPSTRASLLRYRFLTNTAIPGRNFSSQTIWREPLSDPMPAEEHPDEHGALDNHQHEAAAEESNLAAIPWYLQVEPPRHVAPIEPPPLPEVPEGSPTVVRALLGYISEDLGLHDLSLLDLRELDPPPALGPNLFMLFGTARSERHLNVSAGRLLRWLRAKHHIHAHADGLLGPNERKLKLRRKAKRAKLLGRTEDEEDDGIKTGWICVNLGTIGRGTEESAVVADDGRVAGFGLSHHGSTVIVQIMTESRRAEMGLETLWGQALHRLAGGAPESNSNDLQLPEESTSLTSYPTTVPGSGRFEDTFRGAPYGKARFYSTERTVTGESAGFEPLLDINTNEALSKVLKYNTLQKHRVFQLLQACLEEPPTFSAQQPPGVSDQQATQTHFLRLSQIVCQGLPPYMSWGFRLATQTQAYENSTTVPVDMFKDVEQLVREMRLYGIEATRKQYLQLLTCIYSSNSSGQREKTKLALELLKTVQQRGHPVLANDIIVTIIEATARSIERSESPQLIRRLEDLLLQADLPCIDEPFLIRLMEAYARRRDWERVWNVWRIPPKYLRPRSAAMYIRIYELAAATRSPVLCTMILRRCFQEMLTEDPPVRPGGAVLTALMQCIRLADPHAERIFESMSKNATAQGRLAKREFVRLLRDIQILAR